MAQKVLPCLEGGGGYKQFQTCDYPIFFTPPPPLAVINDQVPKDICKVAMILPNFDFDQEPFQFD